MKDLISRRAVLKLLAAMPPEEAMTKALLIQGVKQMDAAQPDPHWIPCGERLPEDDVEVLVTDDAGGVQWLGVDKMLSYEDGSGRFWLVSQNPSAWMPLPAPYCSEGEKK